MESASGFSQAQNLDRIENLNDKDLRLGPKGSSLLEPQSFLLELAGGEQTPSQEVRVTTMCPQKLRQPDSLQNGRLQAASQNRPASTCLVSRL